METIRRVVVTGMGAVTPLGLNGEDFWNSLVSGVLGIGRIGAFDASGFPVCIAAEVRDYDPTRTIDRKTARRMDRFSQFALTAAREAWAMAGLEGRHAPERTGVILGNGIGGILSLVQEQHNLDSKGPERVSPFFVPAAIGNMPGGNIAIELGCKGPNMTVVTACASATNALGEAFGAIRDDRADVVISGGTEASVCPLALAGFASMSALSDSDDPARGSIPFDRERTGFVMGEGAGILVLEELGHALRREAPILGEICGYGTTCDAFHITAPETGGHGALQAMRQALAQAGVAPEEVGYINAHGTGTPYNDEIETLAIRTLFGEHADALCVSSTKSMTGHLLGAAGAVEAIACLRALETGVLPPTIGLREPDPACDLDYVPLVSRKKEIRYALSNSLGFGGHNAVLLMRRWDS